MLCCAVLVCYRFVGSFRSRLVRWFVRSSRLVGSFVRSSRFCLLVHSLARLAACVQDELSSSAWVTQTDYMHVRTPHVYAYSLEGEGKRERDR